MKKECFQIFGQISCKNHGILKKSVKISKSLKNSTINFQSLEIIKKWKSEVKIRKFVIFRFFSKFLTKLAKISKKLLLKSSKIAILVKTLFRHSFYLKKGKRVSERSLKSVKE